MYDYVTCLRMSETCLIKSLQHLASYCNLTNPIQSNPKCCLRQAAECGDSRKELGGPVEDPESPKVPKAEVDAERMEPDRAGANAEIQGVGKGERTMT